MNFRLANPVSKSDLLFSHGWPPQQLLSSCFPPATVNYDLWPLPSNLTSIVSRLSRTLNGWVRGHVVQKLWSGYRHTHPTDYSTWTTSGADPGLGKRSSSGTLPGSPPLGSRGSGRRSGGQVPRSWWHILQIILQWYNSGRKQSSNCQLGII